MAYTYSHTSSMTDGNEPARVEVAVADDDYRGPIVQVHVGPNVYVAFDADTAERVAAEITLALKAHTAAVA